MEFLSCYLVLVCDTRKSLHVLCSFFVHLVTDVSAVETHSEVASTEHRLHGVCPAFLSCSGHGFGDQLLGAARPCSGVCKKPGAEDSKTLF